jgi:hypothetical protein
VAASLGPSVERVLEKKGEEFWSLYPASVAEYTGGGGGLQAVDEEIYRFGWEDRRGKGSYAGDYNPMRLSAVSASRRGGGGGVGHY